MRFPGLTAAMFAIATGAMAEPEIWTRDAADPWGVRVARAFGVPGFERSVAVLIAAGDYGGYWTPLSSPSRDLEKLARFLKGPGEFDAVYTFEDAAANIDDIRTFMDVDLPAILSSQDRLLFYFSGHGQTRTLPNREVGYLVLPQAETGADYSRMLDMREMRIWWENLSFINQSLFLIDACFSGIGLRPKNDLKARAVAELSNRGHHIMTAGTAEQESFGDLTRWGGSLFTEALIRGMQGAADLPVDGLSKDGVVSLKELWAYVDNRVRSEAPPDTMSPQLAGFEFDSEGEFFFFTDDAESYLDADKLSEVPQDEARSEIARLTARIRELENAIAESKGHDAEGQTRGIDIAALPPGPDSIDDAHAGAFPPAEMGARTSVDIGIELGFTGPIESLAEPMALAAELAVAEVNDSGAFFDGLEVVTHRADSTCIDTAVATASARRLIEEHDILAMVGADCSGVTSAVLSNVAVPYGVPMISPSATSPALSTFGDNGLFFRTTPSDSRQAEVLSAALTERGIRSVAVTYTNNDYGKGLSDSFVAAFEDAGGRVTVAAPHEDGKWNYDSEAAALADTGATSLVVFGYADGGGRGIVQAASAAEAFSTLVLGDGMYSQSLLDDLGPALDGALGIVPADSNEGAARFWSFVAPDAGFGPDSIYAAESYDAAALLLLAMARGGAPTSAAAAANVMAVANPPGVRILPGELGHGLEVLASGGEIDYVGATDVTLTGPGEAAGHYRIFTVADGAFETLEIR